MCEISKIIDNIDDKYINEAMEYEMLKPEAKGQWMKWGIMAACLTIVILAGAIVIPSFLESGVSEQRLVTLEEMNRPYRDLEVEKISCAFGSNFLVEGMASGWPAQYLTLAERTDSLSFDENFYEMHGWADDSYIWEILLTCKDAEYVGNIGNIWNSIDFAVTVKKLGLYNRFFRITEDGITFKVSLEDIRVRRYVECMKMQVSDLVWIDFREGINVKEDNLVSGVFQIGKAIIWDGTKQIINGEGHFIRNDFGAKN